MSEVIINKYLDFGGLRKYDERIKAYIASGDDVLRGELAAAIDALNAKIGELEGSDDKSLAEIIEGIYASIAEVVEAQEAKDGELEGKINAIVGDLASLEDGVSEMTLVEVANKLKAIEGSVSQNATDIADVKGRVSTLEGTIEDLKNLGGENGLVAVVDKVNANITAIEKLNGEVDVEGSVKKTAADAAAAALEEAKGYADGLVTDAEGKSLFDEAGAAAAAQSAAEAYADGLAGNYDAAGTAAGLNAAMDTRMTGVEGDVAVLKAIDHDKLAAVAAATAVAAVVAGAESDFDTLKDVADWIGSHKEGAAELQTTVSGHTDSINTINGELDALEAKVDVDITNLSTHMTEAAAKIVEVDNRLAALDAFVEAHDRIPDADINSLFGITTEE